VAEHAAWEAVDPLRLLAEYLTRTGCLDAAAIDQAERHIAAEIAGAFEHALASPNPTEEDLYRHVYAD
jgi:pyruvate dehydrogenase E1 component alpha subunit